MTQQNTRIIAEIQNEISKRTEKLEDDDYIEVLEEIASYCETCAEAKREEADDDTADDAEEEDDDD